MTGSFNEIDHASCGLNRQRMGGEARLRQDVGRHFAGNADLLLRRLGEQRDHQILQRYHANAKLLQLGVS